MGYNRLENPDPKPEPDPTRSTSPIINPTPRKNYNLKFTLIITATIVAACAALAVVAVVVIRAETGGDHARHRRPSQAMSRACNHTMYQTLCLDSLLDFPGADVATENELVHISVNVTLRNVGRALYSVSEISNLEMDPLVRSAYEDCIDLLGDSIDLLSRSLSSVVDGGAAPGDVRTWLSAALTNQDTCNEGFEELDGEIKTHVSKKLSDLSEHVSNSLAIYTAMDELSDEVSVENRRRLMSIGGGVDDRFPTWLSRRDRVLLDTPVTEISADVVVSGDGKGGALKTIAEAIKKAPENGNRRFVIYVRAGRYQEDNLKVGRKKTNIMLIGDGKGKTVITGSKSVQNKVTTFRTASFASTGTGFVARDITFENTAGPTNHQAVALRVGADHAVIYRCSIVGYQDTLYAHSNRQFYRDCDIYGTVDFIFGNAAVVFQSCTMHARKPMSLQKVTVTAQNRKDPNQNTGISIHDCRIVAEPDLEPVKGEYPTFLGRPWKMYSRVVYMMSYLGDHVDKRGWLEWNGDFALDTLYYGEYANYGPGSGVGGRVKWKGYEVITSKDEASKFTVGRFIYGSSWLPATGVAFVAGLST